MICQACGKELPGNHLFCPFCGWQVEVIGPTVSVGQTGAAVAPARISDHVSGQPAARFLPGTVIAERYRIVGQIGRGGMGEVYRSDDLRVGQTVALKFLPESLTHDPTALARVNREVRMARQVSHPNVCRVFDVGEADGVPFISMEFVDGEDLASLLQRIGRLPQDKALQVAHQLCAGLAEAHAFGVLHRDLKPANIMLDGRGNVRITDFGLATTTEELTGETGRAGTPAYMAPEQLAGQKATTQSDLYALGLVLYELFTGKEAYPCTTIAEMLAQRQKGAPAKLSAVVKGLDPAIERVIFQCLGRDPHNRPRSALVVAAALPGGDPLAAAIAAGETPSPEMVAAATDEPLVSVARLWLMTAAIVCGLAIAGFFVQNGSVLGLAPLERSPGEMAEHARQLLRRVSYTSPPADRAYWYEPDIAYLRFRANQGRTPEQRRQLGSTIPGPMRFIYRQSPRKLWAFTSFGSFAVSRTEPPDDTPGMITVVLDGAGRLLSFSALPPAVEPKNSTISPPDWTALFSEAGLDERSLSPAPAEYLPQTPSDSSAAWNGMLGGEPVHVIAAAYRGRPVYFRLIAPWAPLEQNQAPSLPLARIVFRCFLVLSMLGSLVLARRNLRLGRGDQKSAVRIAVLMFLAAFAEWLFKARHVPDFTEYLNYAGAVGEGLYYAALMYLAYLALEPYVRRRWPQILISWTRVLTGRFSDARVGRDLLAGCLTGVLVYIVVTIQFALPTWLNMPGQSPNTPRPLEGLAGAAGRLAGSLQTALIYALVGTLVLMAIRLVVRRRWVMLLLWVALAAPIALIGERSFIAIPVAVVAAALILFVLFRAGILGCTAAFFTHLLLLTCVLTIDPSRWYFWSSVLVLVIVGAMVIHALRAALAGRPVFGQVVLEE